MSVAFKKDDPDVSGTSHDPTDEEGQRDDGITVIIAVRNGLPFVREAVSSALAQNKTGSCAHEVIVVDDNSTDGTLDALSAIGDPHLRLVRSPGRGVSAARNYGITLSRTRWLLFLDADDRLRPGAATALLSASRPGLCGVYGDYERIDETGHAFGRRGWMRHRRRKPSGDVLDAILAGNFLINGGVMICDRELCRKVGGFDPDLSLCEDWHLWCRLAALAPLLYVPVLVMDYRVHHASVMMHKRRTFEEFQPALGAIFTDPFVTARIASEKLHRLRHDGAGSLMTYCAQQAVRSRAYADAWSLTRSAIRHQPRRAEWVLARVLGAAAGL